MLRNKAELTALFELFRTQFAIINDCSFRLLRHMHKFQVACKHALKFLRMALNSSNVTNLLQTTILEIAKFVNYVNQSRASNTDVMAFAPSPTAVETCLKRFVRTSPAANTPGMLVLQSSPATM